MRIGNKQYILLKRALYNESISIYDVKLVYGYEDKAKRSICLENLEFSGLIYRVDKLNWKLTEEGKQVIKNKLRSIRNGVNK